MRVGDIFRYARPYGTTPIEIDGLPNYFAATATPGSRLALLDSGINPIQDVMGVFGSRCPAILISSSPHKVGSVETPWQDFFDPDHGFVRYFGDTKDPSTDPEATQGNRALLDAFMTHSSPDREVRETACPVILFKRVRVGSRTKGNVQFQGFGIVRRAERITQFDRKLQRPFTNYMFDFTVFSSSEENEEFDWDWVSTRRDTLASNAVCMRKAPASWKNWVLHGETAVERSRRRVYSVRTFSVEEQRPAPKSSEAKALGCIYDFYRSRRSRFESLASLVAGTVLGGDSKIYREGWITPASSDNGADFIGRVDLANGMAQVKVVVLGQAKCEKLDCPTGGNHIARTVARLKRGWIGVYVTTSYFSVQVQREVLEDKYPLVMIDGLRLAKEVLRLAHIAGSSTIVAFLETVDSRHDEKVMNRIPEEILHDP